MRHVAERPSWPREMPAPSSAGGERCFVPFYRLGCQETGNFASKGMIVTNLDWTHARRGLGRLTLPMGPPESGKLEAFERSMAGMAHHLRFRRWCFPASLFWLCGGCRLPPPPTREDFSRGWSRQEPVAARAADRLARPPNRPGADLVDEADPGCDTPYESASGGVIDFGDDAAMDRVIASVLERNSDLEAAEAAWRAALELYPQAASWKDPNFRFQNGPTLFGTAQGSHLWRMQFAQEIPWFGKSGLRGELADRTADVSHYEWRRSRQRLVTQARRSYIEYAVSERLRDLQDQDYQLALTQLEEPPAIAQAG